MNRNSLLIGVGGVALAGVLLMGMAGAGGGGGSRGAERLGDSPLARLIRWSICRMVMLGEELDLTAEQRERIAEVMDSHRKEAQPIVRNVVDKRRVLRDAMLSDEISEKVIREAAVDLGSAMGEAAILRARIGKEARQVLTEEQIEVLMQFIEERDNRVDQWIDQLGRSGGESIAPGS
ncbi:MAG: Spy/CpxP family protein refolding chaperone [Acidobacteriota bacterium]